MVCMLLRLDGSGAPYNTAYDFSDLVPVGFYRIYLPATTYQMVSIRDLYKYPVTRYRRCENTNRSPVAHGNQKRRHTATAPGVD